MGPEGSRWYGKGMASQKSITLHITLRGENKPSFLGVTNIYTMSIGVAKLVNC